MFASFRVTLCPIGYNTKLVKAEEAPKSLQRSARPEMGRQDDQGASVLQRHDPDRDLPDRRATSAGSIFEKLAKQKIMQVQSATDPPKKLELGERMVCADGNEYIMLQEKEAGRPSRSSIRPKARR